MLCFEMLVVAMSCPVMLRYDVLSCLPNSNCVQCPDACCLLLIFA